LLRQMISVAKQGRTEQGRIDAGELPGCIDLDVTRAIRRLTV
jgi:hypothetical protein